MTGEEGDYEKASALIGEATAGVPEGAEIDVEEMLSNRIDIKSVAYSEVSKLLESTEVKGAEAAQQQQIAQQKAAAQRIEAQIGKPFAGKGKEVSSAAKALGWVVGAAGRELEKSVTKEVSGISAKKLVMPRLSAQDQLSELEAIQEGMSEGVFDERHMAVIAEEVRWLCAASEKEDTARLSDVQKEMVALRNQKAMEVAASIGISAAQKG